MKTARERISWAIQFTQKEITQMRPGERLDLEEDLLTFIGTEEKASWSPEEIIEAQKAARGVLSKIGVSSVMLERTSISPEQLPSSLSRDVKIDVKDVNEFKLSFPRPGHLHIKITSLSLKPAFLLALSFALAEIGIAYVRHCLTCQKTFLAEHGRQRSCSTACRNKKASWEYRQRVKQEKAAQVAQKTRTRAAHKRAVV